MFDSLSLSDLFGSAVLCSLAAVAEIVLTVLRHRREKHPGIHTVAGRFRKIEPHAGMTRLVRLATKKPGGGLEDKTVPLRGADLSLPVGAPAAFLLLGGQCLAYQTAAGLVVLKNPPRRLTHFWPRCVLAPFAGYFYAAILAVMAAMSGSMGDRQFFGLWKYGCLFFIPLQYVLIFASLHRLRNTVGERLPELAEAYRVASSLGLSRHSPASENTPS